MFKIVIDENVARLFWLQAISKWRWKAFIPISPSKKINLLIEDFYLKEKKSLDKFAKVLNKKEINSNYLWARYTNQEYKVNTEDFEIINNAENKFSKVFKYIWNTELDDIKKWVNEFEANDRRYNKFLYKVKDFLRSEFKFPKCINIHPIPCSNLTGATTHIAYPDTFLLQHGSCFNYSITSTKFLLHELVHQIQFNSKSDELLEKSFLDSEIPQILSDIENSPPSLYIAREILVHSIISIQTPSYFSKIFPKSLVKSSCIELPNLNKMASNDNDVNLDKYNDWYKFFRYVAFSSSEILTNYMDDNKEVDKDYTDKLAKITTKYLKQSIDKNK